jgi:hypothetical protein
MYMNKRNSSKFENFIFFGALILFMVLFVALVFQDGTIWFYFLVNRFSVNSISNSINFYQ